MDGVELKFQPEALERVAEVALERKTGARGLRGVLENVMTDIMFRIPSDETVCRVEITPGVVDGTGEPVVEHGERTGCSGGKEAAEKGFRAESRPRAHNRIKTNTGGERDSRPYFQRSTPLQTPEDILY